jgi:late competence protein required for DNA uptake (superfamily II DNA/RNA helicase)
VSDVNKPLLIDNRDFIPYLVDALLLVSISQVLLMRSYTVLLPATSMHIRF